MTDRIEAAKPYAVGFVAGIVVAPIIAFSLGWVSTAGARDTAVENARIETLANVCTQAAHASWASRNLELAELQGSANRAKREELVAQVTEGFAIPQALQRRVTTACSRSI